MMAVINRNNIYYLKKEKVADLFYGGPPYLAGALSEACATWIVVIWGDLYIPHTIASCGH